jgi:hypothetical protein
MRRARFGPTVRPMRLRVLIAMLIAATTVPAAQAGAVTIGSGAVGSPSPAFFGCSGADPCMLIQDTINGTPVRVPDGSWVMTSWRVRGAEGTVGLQVIQPTGGTADSLDGTVKASSPDLAGAGNAADAVQEQSVRIAVGTGDMIGLGLDGGASVGGQVSGANTVIFEAPLATPFSSNGFGNVEQLVQATIEPDSDGDGFGDATQDGCPTSQATQGACPQPPGPPDPLDELRGGGKPSVRLASRRVGAPKGTVAIEVINPNGYAVSGTLTLKQKRKKVGSKRYSIPAGESRRVKVKLTARARKALKRARKLKLSASASVRGPIGAAGALKATLTVLRRAVRPPAGGGGGRFAGRTKNIAAEFRFDLAGEQIQNAIGEIMVTCFYPGGTSRSGVEVWDPPGAFPLGQKTEQFADGKPSAILGSTVRKRYTLEAARSGDTVTGTIQVSYSFSAYNPQTGMAQGSSCVGEDTFTARRL